MKKLLVIMLLIFTVGCAHGTTFKQNAAALVDREYQARMTALDVINSVFKKTRKSFGCHVNTEFPLPKVLKQDTNFVRGACRVEENEPTPAGCYIKNGNIIVLKERTVHDTESYFTTQHHTLVHEYIHFYTLNSNLSELCYTELAAHLGADAGTGSLKFYRLSL